MDQIFTQDLGWLFREQPTSDFGIDAHVEVVLDGRATGWLIALQIKSGASFFRRQTAEGVKFYGIEGHLDYWSRHSLPVVVVLYDPTSKSAYWQHVSDATTTRTRKGWRMLVPRRQRLSAAASDELHELAEGDPYILRLRRLQLERPWMRAIANGKRLMLEVDEWATSPQAVETFDFLSRTPLDGNRLPACGPSSYSRASTTGNSFPRCFPWAAMKVDKNFYEAYDEARWDEDEGVWDSETGTYIVHLESFSEWAAANLPDGIRPYEEGDEVAKWRLELTLNDLGGAFLEVDEFLSSADAPWTQQ